METKMEIIITDKEGLRLVSSISENKIKHITDTNQWEDFIKEILKHTKIQYKPINDEDNLKLPFIHHKPIPISEIDFSEPKPMMNPITYELINPELWEDGLHLQPNIMSENFEINMVYEVKNKKVIKVYKNE
jgi:hypothetical protein